VGRSGGRRLKASTVISPTEPAVRRYRSGLFRKDRRRGSGRLREAVEIVRKLQDRFPCAGMVNCSPPPALARRGRTILFRRRPHRRREAWPPEVGFAVDSPLEGDGFEPSVPRHHGRRFRDTTFVGLKHLAAMRRRMRNSTPEHRYHNVPKTAGPDCQLASSIVGAGIAGAGQRAARRFLKFR
jgi:hypothetical protein